MIRKIASCFCMVLLLSGVATAELHNPGFERVPFRAWLGPWGGGSEQSRGDGFIVMAGLSEFVRSGERAIRLTVSDPADSAGKAWCGITQVYPCKAGSRVTASAWIFDSLDEHPLRSNVHVQLKVEYCGDDDGQVVLSDHDFLSDPLPVDDQRGSEVWTLLEAEDVAPEDARSLKLSVVLVADRVVGVPQSVWVDDVSLDVEGVTVDGESVRPQPDPLTVPEVLLARGSFYKGGHPFWLKGVGYSPYRPGYARNPQMMGPVDALREDMRRIRAAGFNTIRTWDDMPDMLYELAAEEGLSVLTGVWAPLGDLTEPALWKYAGDVVREKIGRLRKHSNILGYLILNEPEPALFDEADEESIQAYINAVVTAAHEMDPFRPCSTTPWIIMWFLDYSQWDMHCYNMYNYFPSAVNTNFGYARFVDYTRRVQADPRPFVITEFGYPVNPTGVGGFAYGGNSHEEQAQGVVDILSAIVAGGAQGGCVFEWNDEWWKSENTENDHLTHDDDPEEYFGLIGFDGLKDVIGTPRPACHAIRDFYDNLVLSPRAGSVYKDDVPLRVYQDDPERVAGYEYSLDGAEWIELEQSGDWYEGVLTYADLSMGTHTVCVRVVGMEAEKQSELTRNLSFGVADESASQEYDVDLRVGPEDRALADPVHIHVDVIDHAGDPVPDHPVRLSLLQTRPVTDTYYEGLTDSNGQYTAVFVPPRGGPISHLNIWASCDMTYAGHPFYAGADLSIPVKGAPPRDPAASRLTITQTDRAPLIDGQLDACWDAGLPLELSLPSFGPPDFIIRGRWMGNEDLSGTINMLWDSEHIYMFVDVVDEEPAYNPYTGSDIWKGDGLEVYLGTDATVDAGDGYASTDYQFILAPEGKTWVYGQAVGGTRNASLSEAEVVTVLTDRGYAMEARIPWDHFSYSPVSGNTVRLEFVLNDAEKGQGLPTKLLWASSGNAYLSSQGWGRAVLTGTSAGGTE